ncbi:hypothetical protein SK128_001681 [Halocaridina rubra]|uniref:Uncharacterized protein n=1 Tax=Halocaridina rubra TaxID=373956 RepID=A0AAN8X350_HALRR
MITTIDSKYIPRNSARTERITRREISGYTVTTTDSYKISSGVQFGVCLDRDTGRLYLTRKYGRHKQRNKKQRRGNKSFTRKGSIRKLRGQRHRRSIETTVVWETLYRHTVDEKFSARRRNRINGGDPQENAERDVNFNGGNAFSALYTDILERNPQSGPGYQRGYVDFNIGPAYGNHALLGYGFHDVNMGIYSRYGGHGYKDMLLNRADDTVPVSGFENTDNLQRFHEGQDIKRRRIQGRYGERKGSYGGSRGGTSIFII